MQGLMVLPEDVQIVAVSELPPQVRSQVGAGETDFALTRAQSRTPSKVIDANAAALLRQFLKPKTIVDAIVAFSREVKARPSDVLEEAYPLIESCLLARLLVEPGDQSGKIEACFGEGDLIAGNVVERVVQALEDSEVYQVRRPDGQLAALKIARKNALKTMEKMLAREASILRKTGGLMTPVLFESDRLEDGRPYLLMQWFDGVDSQIAAHKIRERGGPEAARELRRLCTSVLDAYAELHARGILHSDIHARNVLVAESGEVRIIDFGVSHMQEAVDAPQRAGVAFFFEAEYAQALRQKTTPPAASFKGEQYALGALIYYLLRGTHYLDFSFEKDEMLRQIAEERPVPFAHEDGHERPLEAVILRALAKSPAQRFSGTAAFAAAFFDAWSALEASPDEVQNSGALLQSEPQKLLDRVLDFVSDPARTLQYKGPAAPTTSVTYGSAGIAYALYRLASVREDVRLLALADAWAERAANEQEDSAFYNAAIQITPENVGRVSPYHTASGVAVVQALIANARGDKMSLDRAIARFLQQSEGECANPDLTLGRASVLLAFTLLLEAGGLPRPLALVERGNELCRSILTVIEQEPPIAEGQTISYLGIAHGWAGLLYAPLRWWKLLDEATPGSVQTRLQQLADCAQLTRHGARWGMQVGPRSIALAGWCNGSAGHTHLWTLAHKVYGEARYLDLAERAACDAFEGGGGGHGLCCGFAGQAYAQLSVYKHTGERRWLDQARELNRKAAAFGNASLQQGDDGLPHSLYKGDIGAAVLAAEMDRPELACMPFFEEEGWPK